eukprot:5737924-Pyramimonas_sp.AAC.1
MVLVLMEMMMAMLVLMMMMVMLLVRMMIVVKLVWAVLGLCCPPVRQSWGSLGVLLGRLRSLLCGSPPVWAHHSHVSCPQGIPP